MRLKRSCSFNRKSPILSVYTNGLIKSTTRFVFGFLISFSGKAQFYNLPNDYSFSILTEKKLAARDSSIHSSLKPYIHFFSEKYNYAGDTIRQFKYITEDPFIDAVFHKHLINIAPKKQNFEFYIDPLLNFEYGRDVADTAQKNLYTNTRGFIISGKIGQQFYFETMLAENQSMFPNYLSNATNSSKVVAGQGRWKTFKTSGFDYAFSSGFISVQATKNFNIQVGHGKHKIGHGYRSLLLSDNAFNYPYAKFTQQWFKGRLQYSNIYAVFMNLVPALSNPTPGTETLFQKKASAFQYLSANLSKSFQLGFFQGLIWKPADERNQQQLDWHYFNPIIYTNLIDYQLNGENNLLIGCDFKWKILTKLNMYGQVMADDLSNSLQKGNSYGIQIGANYFDAFGIENLFFQAEANHVSNNSYTNPDNAGYGGQSYTHYNQVIGYTPMRGNEIIFLVNYRFKRAFVDIKYNYQTSDGFQTIDAYTNSILSSKIGYVINPKYNLNVFVGLNSRLQNFYNLSLLNKTNYIYLGLRTSIYNFYYDF